MKLLGDKKGLKGRLKRLKYLAKKSQVIQLKSQPAANLIFMSVCTMYICADKNSALTNNGLERSQIRDKRRTTVKLKPFDINIVCHTVLKEGEGGRGGRGPEEKN
jgi:hypothetical protein